MAASADHVAAEAEGASPAPEPGAPAPVRARPLAEAAVASLCAAAAWVAFRQLWAGAPPATPAGLVALGGCASSSFVLAALAFGPVPPARAAAMGSQALSLGLCWALPPWVLLARWLLLATHHRPLGAVTFAAFASAIGAVSVLAARRLLHATAAEGRSRAWLVTGRALALIALVGTLGLLLRAGWAHEQVRSALPEVGVGITLVLLVIASLMVPWPARVPRWAPLLCVGVWITTLCLVAAQPDVRATVKSAPFMAGLLGLVLR